MSPLVELGFNDLDQVGEQGEVSIVQATASGQLPDTLDGVEFWIVGRQEAQF